MLSTVCITGHHCNTANPANFVLFFRTVYLAAEDLDGQGTFGMGGNTEKEEIPLEIREGSSALRFVPNINCWRKPCFGSGNKLEQKELKLAKKKLFCLKYFSFNSFGVQIE